MFEYSRCQCGEILITDTINLKDGDKPFVEIAKATICGYARIHGIKPFGVAGITLSMIQRVYEASRFNSFTLEELQSGIIVHGIRTETRPTARIRPMAGVIDNPDRNYETERKEFPL